MSVRDDPPDSDEASADEFLDAAPTESALSTTPVEIDRSVVTHPLVLRAVAGVVAAGAIVFWPDRSDQILARLIGVGAVAFGVGTLIGEFRRPATDTTHRRVDLALAVIGIIAGLALTLAPPGWSAALLGQGLGVLCLLQAMRRLLTDRRRHGHTTSWGLAQSVFLACVGLLLVLFPGEVLTWAALTFAVGWAALSLIAIVQSLDASTDDVWGYADAGQLVYDWLIERPKSADDRHELYDKILYEGPDARRRLSRFFTLMTFAAVIASVGVVAESTAVVIGAMLIAPLMRPLMGVSISLVMGWPVRLAHSAVVAVSGILLAVAIGVTVGLLLPAVLDTTTNAEILARVSPTTLDLVIAVAAGGAGAYGLSRPDVSDALPGVAIAISLVPPLTVVGITLSQAAWGQAAGASLLFAVNAVAIIIMGGLVFVITGVTPLQRLAENQHRVRTVTAGVAALAIVIVGALLLNGDDVARDISRLDEVEGAVDTWLDDTDRHRLIDLTIDDDLITVVILGPVDDAPTAETLAGLVANALDQPVVVDVRLAVEERQQAEAEPDG
ncbi:MAG: DUF389 domain-containing protein [Actinomycetota bacterium]